MLLGAPFTDEVCAALALLNADEAGEGAGLAAAWLSLVFLAAPQGLGLFVEARLLLWAFQRPTRLVLGAAWGLTGLGYAAVTAWPAALPWVFAVVGVSEGLAAGVAGAAAVAAGRRGEASGAGEADGPAHGDGPEESEADARVLSRLALAGALGDLAGPALAAGLAALGLGWKGVFLVAAAWLLLHAAAAAASPLPPATAEDHEAPADLASLLAGLRADPGLVVALLGAVSCALLDEILLLFGVAWLAERGVPGPERALAFGAFALGLTLGAAALEPALRRTPARHLALLTAVGTTLAYVAWLATAAPGWLLLTGIFTAPLHPLAEARAYAGRAPVLVAAASRVVGVVEVALPLVVGLAAQELGLRAALTLLLAQPLVVGVSAWAERPRRPPGAPARTGTPR